MCLAQGHDTVTPRAVRLKLATNTKVSCAGLYIYIIYIGNQLIDAFAPKPHLVAEISSIVILNISTPHQTYKI